MPSHRTMLLLFTLLAYARTADAQGTYTFVKVELPFASAGSALVSGINNRGELVGSYVGADLHTHAFIATGDGYRSFDAPGADRTWATGINDQGDFVGQYEQGAMVRGFIVARGRFSTLELPFPGAEFVSPTAINQRGDIIGTYSDGSASRSFLRTRGSYRELQVPFAGAYGTAAIGMNARGAIVGTYLDASGMLHSFLFGQGSYTTIDEPGSSSTVVTAINDRGVLAGYASQVDENGLWKGHGFVYHSGRFDDFVAIFPDLQIWYTHALGINDAGAIVGRAFTAKGVTMVSFLAQPEHCR